MNEPTKQQATETHQVLTQKKASNKTKVGKASKPKQVHEMAFIGATVEFDRHVFTMKDEYTGAPSRFDETLQRGEVFVAKQYPKSARAMSSLFGGTPKNPSLAPPPEPIGEDREDDLTIRCYLEDRKEHLKLAKELENSLHSFFTVLWGQCSPGIQSKLSSKLDFLIKKEAGDCSWLLDEIR